MKRVLILGAGLSVGPLASYFHERGHHLTIACRRPEAARALAGGSIGAAVVELDVRAPGERLASLAAEHDLVASFVPGSCQPRVALACLEARRPLVMSCHHHYLDAFPGGTAALDERARAAGVAIVTELGVDCGYLGMLAKREIDRLSARGRRVRSLRFHTGVIPADAINPFHYAFFWAAKKAALSYVSPAAGKADWIRGGARVPVDARNVYAEPALVEIAGAGPLETHPNLDSGGWEYEHVYGVDGIDELYHGTLRHLGWCNTLAALVALGFDAAAPRPDLAGRPFREVVAALCGGGQDARACAAAKLSLRRHDDTILRLEWLGLFGDRPAKAGIDGSPSDLLTELMLERLGVFGYDSGVRSRVVNRFDIVSLDAAQGGPSEILRSDFDVVDDGRGHSICSRLISQTTAIAGRHLLDGELAGWTGLHHPYQRIVYEPVLRELEQEGIGNAVSVGGQPAAAG
jgi:saccharopine dehydrogenase-like NADP-dependent oxidoreductase